MSMLENKLLLLLLTLGVFFKLNSEAKYHDDNCVMITLPDSNCSNLINYKMCVSPETVCDGESDTMSGADEHELLCKNWTCIEDRWMCWKQGLCIGIDHRCNGEFDCDWGEDEQGCEDWTCLPGYYKCDDGLECVTLGSRCDYDPDCHDNSDEKNCEHVPCPHGRWKCANRKKCIAEIDRCDGRQHCSDNSDEIGCANYTCPKGYWKCADGLHCLYDERRCDGYPHCSDKSDESGCNATICNNQGSVFCHDDQECKRLDLYCRRSSFRRCSLISFGTLKCLPVINTCPRHKWKCIYRWRHRCIPLSWVCNGKSECDQDKDESKKFCETWKCTHGWFKCEEDPTKCISMKHICDGVADCPLMSDELYCADYKVQHRYLCNDQKWFTEYEQIAQLEDGILHCSDGSDELICDGGKYSCYDDLWLCKDKRSCINPRNVCDAEQHCPDGSDEDEDACPLVTCHEFECKAKKKCLDYTKLCDGNPKCEDEEDEKNCLKSCNNESCKCFHSTLYISRYQICDGKNDCQILHDTKDESDEADCTDELICNAPMIKCSQSNRCIWPSALCDGLHDCTHGEDELCNSDCSKHLSAAVRSKEILARCQDGSGICIPVNKYCDGKTDCPQGVDEISCSCADWGTMETRGLYGINHCLPGIWVQLVHPVCGDYCRRLNSNHNLDTTNTSKNHKNDMTVYVRAQSSKNASHKIVLQIMTDDLIGPLLSLCEKKWIEGKQRSIGLACHAEVISPNETTNTLPNIVMHGLTFLKSVLRFRNIRLAIENSTFYASRIYFSSAVIAEVTITHSYFVGTSGQQESGLYVYAENFLKLHCNKALFDNSDVYISGLVVWLDILKTVFKETHINISAYGLIKTVNWIHLSGVSLLSHSSKQMRITADNVILEIKNSYIFNISLTVQDHSNLNSYIFCLKFIRTVMVFTKASQRKADEGMLEIYLRSPEKASQSSIDFFNTTFIHKGQQAKVFSFGDGITLIKVNANSQLNIICSFSEFIFSHCDHGCTILSLPEQTDSLIRNSIFIGSGIAAENQGNHALLISKGKVRFRKTQFYIQDNGEDVKYVVLQVASLIEARILSVRCPIWYKSEIRGPDQEASELTWACVKCIETMYTLTLLPSRFDYIPHAIDKDPAGGDVEHTADDNHVQKNTRDLTDKDIEFTPGDISYNIKNLRKIDNDFSPDSTKDLTDIDNELSPDSIKQFTDIDNEISPDSTKDVTDIDNKFSPDSTVEKLNADPVNNKEECTRCPYGGHCSGFRVTPQPNFWGYIHNSSVEFLQCPFEYCCLGTNTTPCHAYNACAGKRTGVLCGVCQPGYTLSILSNNCVPIDSCNLHIWFWFVSLLLSFLYFLWYTFKNDLFSIPFYIVFLHSYISVKLKKLLLEPLRLSSRIQVFGTTGKKMQTLVKDQSFECTSKYKESKNGDKYYFGILTNFIQMYSIIRISIEFSDITNETTFLDHFENYVSQVLNFEILSQSLDLCPLAHISTAHKLILKLFFFLSIYICSLVIWYTVGVAHSKFRWLPRTSFTELQDKMIVGIVETVKYTNSGFAGIVLMALSCTYFKNGYIWLYDGTVSCYSQWQIGLLAFGLFNTLPFPLALYLGMKSLKADQISWRVFILTCIFPLAGSIYICIRLLDRMYQNYKKKATQTRTSLSSEDRRFNRIILDLLQAPYKTDTTSGATYWECHIGVRRLFISSAILISNNTMRLLIYIILCCLFFGHHTMVFPYKIKSSNYLDWLSLLFLVILSAINLLKACLVDAGIIPTGSLIKLYQTLQLIEPGLLVILAVAIAVSEVWSKAKMLHGIKYKAPWKTYMWWK